MTRYSSLQKCLASCVFTTNRHSRGGGGLITGQKLNAFVLDSRTPTQRLWKIGQLKGCCDIRHRSLYSSVNKVRVWCATWVYLRLYLCFRHCTEKSFLFYPDSASLVQNCQHPVSNLPGRRRKARHNGAKTEHGHEAKNTHWTFKWCICHKLAILSWKIKYLKSTSGASDTNTRA